MKKLLLTFLMLSLSVTMSAQLFSPGDLLSGLSRSSSDGVSFEYDAKLSYFFDNREFGASQGMYEPSQTVSMIRLTPTVGFAVRQNYNVTHRVMLGVDLEKRMGEDDTQERNLGIIHEALLYYDAFALLEKGTFRADAGVFPWSFARGDYGSLFRSDLSQALDPNIEGLLMNYTSSRSFAELGYDWMGAFSETRRERFRVFASCLYILGANLDAGLSVSLFHLASSGEIHGVVDNAFAFPYLKISPFTRLQEFYIKAGPVIGYQRDRVQMKTADIPTGFETDLRLSRKHLSLDNTLYYGQPQMPFYRAYGDLLYQGIPFYGLLSGENLLYDRLELSYNRHIASFLEMRSSLVMHFSDVAPSESLFAGWQQKITLYFNLDALRHPERYRPTAKGRNRRDAKRYGGTSYAM